MNSQEPAAVLVPHYSTEIEQPQDLCLRLLRRLKNGLFVGNVQANVYLPYRVIRPRAQMRLFCFPYAGGNAAVFQKWHRALPESIEVCALQYPGRGNRMREPAFTNAIPLAHDLSQALMSLLDLPFAFFGHSMGGIIAFEVARELRREQVPQPLHLFVSSVRAPQFPNRDRIAYDMPEPQFKEELRRLNGTPAEVLENAELMNLMLPILRADFAVAQTYAYVEEPPLSCPVNCMEVRKTCRFHYRNWKAGANRRQALSSCNFLVAITSIFMRQKHF